LSALELAAVASTTNEISRSVGRFFTGWDVLVTPTVNTAAWPLGELDQNASGVGPEEWLGRIFDLCSFAPLFNVTGTPAVSLPLGETDGGLPIGVQLAADMCGEPTLLRLAAQLETALPWEERLPAVHAGS
jgi:amidase